MCSMIRVSGLTQGCSVLVLSTDQQPCSTSWQHMQVCNSAILSAVLVCRHQFWQHGRRDSFSGRCHEAEEWPVPALSAPSTDCRSCFACMTKSQQGCVIQWRVHVGMLESGRADVPSHSSLTTPAVALSCKTAHKEEQNLASLHQIRQCTDSSKPCVQERNPVMNIVMGWEEKNRGTQYPKSVVRPCSRAQHCALWPCQHSLVGSASLSCCQRGEHQRPVIPRQPCARWSSAKRPLHFGRC